MIAKHVSHRSRKRMSTNRKLDLFFFGPVIFIISFMVTGLIRNIF